MLGTTKATSISEYSLIDAATLIDQLTNFEETDSGLWEGRNPEGSHQRVQAAYTYGNAVYNEWRELIEKINSEASGIIGDFDETAEDVRRYRRLRNRQAGGPPQDD